MRILVTGGAGFIGSHVVEALLGEGGTVRVLDSLHASVHGAPPELDERAELMVGDVTDPAAVWRATAGVDAVCHQAARVGLGVDFGDVTSYVGANDGGTAVLLEALWRRRFTGRLVLASSMVIYGEGLSECLEHGAVRTAPRSPEDLREGQFEPRCWCGRVVRWLAVHEDTPPDPRNVYAATKLQQEHLCRLWGRESGATVIVLRYHNVYGPRMPRDTQYAGVASIFRSEVSGGRPPRVFEDGGQTRDFVHVRDVARANVLALTQPDAPPGAYNIASGTPRTVLDLASAVCAVAGPEGAPGPVPVVTGDYRLGDVRHIVASPVRAAEALGFEAAVDFGSGMAEFASAPMRGGLAR